MTPSRSSRPRRSATAGEERPTRRPSSASERRASACSSTSRRRFVESRPAASAEASFCLRFAGMALRLPAIASVRGADYAPSCGSMSTATRVAPPALADRAPPHVWFVGSAVFHYLGPAFAVLLFARMDVLGVAWLRIASAAVVLGLWRRPWRAARRLDRDGRRLLIAWG